MVLSAQAQVRAEWLHNPDDFWHSLPKRFKSTQKSIAEGLFDGKLCYKDISVVDNLTVAVSVIVHSIVANITTPNSVIVMSTLTYNAVKNAVNYGISQAHNKNNNLNITVLTVDIPFPLVAAEPRDALLTVCELM